MTFKGAWTGAALCAVVVMVAMPSAHAQDTDARALMDRIERLERDIRTLNVQIARGGSGTAQAGSTAPVSGNGDPAYARLSVRMSQVENDLRGMTGRIEELTYQVNQISQNLEKLVTDVDFRLKQLEHGGGATSMGQPMTGSTTSMAQPQPMQTSPSNIAANPLPPGGQPSDGTQNMPAGTPDGSQVLGQLSASDLSNPQTNATATPAPAPQSEADALLAQLTGEAPAPAAPAPLAAPAPASVNTAATQPSAVPSAETAALPEGTPREQYMHAFGLLRQGKYDLAASSLRQFIEQHGTDKLASNARYWLGETYYVRGAFVEAAETFLEGYQTDPQGPKAPDALLKLGMSLSSLEKKSEACAAFQKLRSDYPDAPAGLKNTLQREWQKNGCV
ncbi:tol-pal system protein YbgF [Thalassospiraceae bacterium LMO-JJ14]|nr:tol-pal system protein YbgF [Thalassospiraceae bacterium LMO-JJ14]